MIWLVYMLECNDGTIYTGITSNINRRLYEHNNTNRGAKYTSTRRPVVLKKVFMFHSRSEASKEEYRIKQLTRMEKLKLIAS